MIFVTGGTGLLGSHLLIELSKRGQKIRALKRKSSDLTEVKKLFSFYLDDSELSIFNKIQWVEGDINDVTSLPKLISGCNTVYHCAGFVSFNKKDFKKLIQINKYGTANVVNTCVKLGVQNFSYVSSTAAIGRDCKQDVITERNNWVDSKSNSNYAVSKYLGEMEAWRGQEEGLNVSIVNPSVILGAGNWNDSSLTLFKSIEKGLKFYPTGTNAFVDARDVAFCMVELIEKKMFGKRFLTISENIKFKDLFDFIANELNVSKPSIKAKSWMISVAWRVDALKNLITRQQPKITKETSASAMQINNYSNHQIVDALNINFIPIKKSVHNAVRYHKLNKN
jgi:nucleoside-diphosphate-sugar epimerase